MNIVPNPTKLTLQEGFFSFSKETGFCPAFPEIFRQFSRFIFRVFDYTVGHGEDVLLLLETERSIPQEGYILEITPARVTITAGDEPGLFYGMQTLKQLVFEYSKEGISQIPCAVIEDAPRFSYRGFMLDSARHFFDTIEVKRLINLCALHKLNVFHWHLADDQGWRFESKKYPKLTSVGSIRSETRGDGIPVSGFYTQNEMRDVVAYASARYITVIPEFDMPGHTTALLAAYPNLACRGSSPVLDVATSFGIKDSIVCAGKEPVYALLADILDEAAEIFPAPFVHLGGDEALKIRWNNCPDCAKTMEANGLKDAEELQAYFTGKMITRLAANGKTAVVWNEAQNSGKLDASALVQFWNDGKKHKRVIDAANNGRKIIVSKFTPYYLDYPHGMHSLKRLYAFEPILNGIKEDSKQNILGVESPIWTEHIPTCEKLESMVFPRLSALAESGWSLPKNKDFGGFKTRLSALLRILDTYNVTYTPLAKTTPNPITGACQTIKFFVKAADKENIKGMRRNMQEQRKARKKTSTQK